MNILPSIPTLESLKSDTLVHRPIDLFNPPTVNNQWGFLHTTKSVSAFTCVAFPPYACVGLRATPGEHLFNPYLTTQDFYLNGRLSTSYPAPHDAIQFTWYPHAVVRSTTIEGIRIQTTTFMPPERRAVAQKITIENTCHERRSFKWSVSMRAGVTRQDGFWPRETPAELDNEVHWDNENACYVFVAQDTAAACVQGITPKPDTTSGKQMLHYSLTLRPGESRDFHYLNLIGGPSEALVDEYGHLQSNPDQILKDSERFFEKLISDAFTPGNPSFSGNLPRLHTTNPALWKLYYTGFTNLLVSRRANPDAFLNPAFLAIPRHQPTHNFIWDMMYVSLGLALLDPESLRKHIEAWWAVDLGTCWGIDYFTGDAVGYPYAVNNFVILYCADRYVKSTGNRAWLDSMVGDKSVFQRLREHALHWKQLDIHGWGLADYGIRKNLLEVVSTYIHGVPSMNAGNVKGMRIMAGLCQIKGDKAEAHKFETEAKTLATRIIDQLYVKGKGFWKSLQPDGSANEVRHCLDFITLFDCLGSDLSKGHKREMADFFWAELATENWMRALSAGDPDATWHLRADHSWLGAYGAWPSMSAKGLFGFEDTQKTSKWFLRLAESANQGPFGQAHIVTESFPAENGGAMKSPIEEPYQNDWSVLAGGNFSDVIIEAVFGVNFTHQNGLELATKTAIQEIDANARLEYIPYQKRQYTCHSNKIERMNPTPI